MLRASALYVSVIVAFVLALITASLITVAYFYRAEYQKDLLQNRLGNNLNSGIAIQLAGALAGDQQILDLYGERKDSILLAKEQWGVFELNIVKSFSLKDTLTKVFLSGISTDNEKEALYLADEDRPLSVSGNTRITGDAILPKSGVKAAFIEGKGFSGRKLVEGNIGVSKRQLPTLDSMIVNGLEAELKGMSNQRKSGEIKEQNSFLNATSKFYAGTDLEGRNFSGRIVIFSDTVLKVANTTVLNDVIIYAPAVVIENGFRGSCQIFARDSIVVGERVVLEYPSCLGILKPNESKNQARIEIGENSQVSGILFTYERKRSDLQTLISIGKNSVIKGEVYATGFVKVAKTSTIYGTVRCHRFVMETLTTLYENFLIDITIDRPARNKYYLTSPLISKSKGNNEVLKWLN